MRVSMAEMLLVNFDGRREEFMPLVSAIEAEEERVVGSCLLRKLSNSFLSVRVLQSRYFCYLCNRLGRSPRSSMDRTAVS